MTIKKNDIVTIMTDKERLLQIVNKQTITVIAGLSKNAGKSTLLNWILRNFRDKKIGVTTTGRDGEDYDLLADNSSSSSSQVLIKPKITIYPNTLFTTRSDVIRKNSSSLAVIEKLKHRAGDENLWIVEAKAYLETEIVGPPSVREQIEIISKMIDYGAEQLFIDGSFDRKAISSAAEIKNILIVAGAGAGNVDKIVQELKHLEMLTNISIFDADGWGCMEHSGKITLLVRDALQNSRNIISLQYDTLLGNENELLASLRDYSNNVDYIYLPASLTERSYSLLRNVLIRHKIGVIAAHPFNIMLSDESLKQLYPQLFAIRTTILDGIAVNSFAADGNHLDCEWLRTAVRNEFYVPVIDVMEIG